jgi:hypothetical protein
MPTEVYLTVEQCPQGNQARSITIMNETAGSPQTDRVECPPARDPAVRLFIFAGMLLAFGGYCFLDAFIWGKYPKPADGNLSDMSSYYFNHVGGIVFPLAGLVPLWLAIAFLRRPLVADAEGLGYEGSPKVRWETVTRLDATQLQEKGILRLHHAAAKPMTLDSWKLTNFKALVAFIEQHVPSEAIDVDAPPADDDSAE